MSTTATETEAPGTIVIDGLDEPIIINPTKAKRRPVLEPDEARALTTEIQRTSVRLWLLVTEAHDRAAHFALGYESWDDYVRAEFKMSPSRSYQLLDTGHLMRELAVAGVDIDHMSPPPTRVVSRVKDRLKDVRKVTKKAVKEGDDPLKALRTLANEPRTPTPRAEGGGDKAPEAEARAPDTDTGRRTVTVTCPACQGDGKVTRSLANRLRPFMKKLTTPKE